MFSRNYDCRCKHFHFYVRHLLGGEAIYALVLGGASMVVAGMMVMFVKDVD